jgi:hypothetical protein
MGGFPMAFQDVLDLLPIAYRRHTPIDSTTYKLEGAEFTDEFGIFAKNQFFDELYIDTYTRRIWAPNGWDARYEIVARVSLAA